MAEKKAASNDTRMLAADTTDPKQLQITSYFDHVLSTASTMKVPTQTQLRALALSIDIYPLRNLGLISDKLEVLSQTEILAKFNSATRATKAIIWILATDNKVRDIANRMAQEEDRESQTFYPFSRLPYELREQIWMAATESNYLVEIKWQKKYQRWWATPSSQVRAPSTSSACRESREATTWVREHQTIKAFGTFVNIQTDLMFLHTVEETLSRRFMNFVMDLWEAAGCEDDAETSLTKFPKLALDWCSWNHAIKAGNVPDDLDVHGEHGLLRRYFKGLKELILVSIESAGEHNWIPFTDDRVLVEEELLDIEQEDSSAALEGVRENLNYAEGAISIQLKRLLRGIDE